MNASATKEEFERIYSKEDPWHFRDSIADKTRRIVLLKHIQPVFSDGLRKTVLDAGCGEGYLTKDVASQYNAEIDAFDISEKAIVIARKRYSHPNINYFPLDLNDFMPNKKYDLILCEEALYYLGDDERLYAVRKFHKAIKAGGYFRLTSIIEGPDRHGRFFTPKPLKKLVVNNGFEVVSIWPSLLKKSLPEKIFYRSLEYMNKAKPVSSHLIEHFVTLTLNRPLDKCRAISILAKKI